MKLGVLTAFTAGMVNVAAWILFFSFASNVTGHYAILAEEIATGKWFQVLVVLLWILLYMGGSFLSNFVVIHGRNKYSFISHAFPLVLEMLILFGVGFYGTYYYSETLIETEVLTALLLFSMGLQNGLTASISNFSVKTTHLTGLTTDLGIHLSMITKSIYRKNQAVRNKIKLMVAIAGAYLGGGVLAGSLTLYFEFKVFFLICLAILFILLYDVTKVYFTLRYIKYQRKRIQRISKDEDVRVQ
jgi:uncharacterized membrane protein YoaK (UPF0700 family)